MLEEDQISFRSASPMYDGVEDYSHQIAEMIGLRNESNFIQAGVSGVAIKYYIISDLFNLFVFLFISNMQSSFKLLKRWVFQ